MDDQTVELFEKFTLYVKDNFNNDGDKYIILSAINDFCYEEDIDFHTNHLEDTEDNDEEFLEEEE